jgi:hypothetical protein
VAKYEALGRVWLHLEGGPRMFRAGETIAKFSGWPSLNMEPKDDEAKKIVELRDRIRSQGGQLPNSPADALEAEKPEVKNEDKAAAATTPRGKTKQKSDQATA